MRSMVEGGCAKCRTPSTTRFARGPLPRPGEELAYILYVARA
jgi:hypothetical protein